MIAAKLHRSLLVGSASFSFSSSLQPFFGSAAPSSLFYFFCFLLLIFRTLFFLFSSPSAAPFVQPSLPFIFKPTQPPFFFPLLSFFSWPPACIFFVCILADAFCSLHLSLVLPFLFCCSCMYCHFLLSICCRNGGVWRGLLTSCCVVPLGWPHVLHCLPFLHVFRLLSLLHCHISSADHLMLLACFHGPDAAVLFLFQLLSHGAFQLLFSSSHCYVFCTVFLPSKRCQHVLLPVLMFPSPAGAAHIVFCFACS